MAAFMLRYRPGGSWLGERMLDDNAGEAVGFCRVSSQGTETVFLDGPRADSAWLGLIEQPCWLRLETGEGSGDIGWGRGGRWVPRKRGRGLEGGGGVVGRGLSCLSRGGEEDGDGRCLVVCDLEESVAKKKGGGPLMVGVGGMDRG